MFKRKKSGLGLGLADHSRKSPLSADEQDAPQPERVTKPTELANQAAGRDSHPSQAEGERDERDR